jgi:hypothetical protein
METPLILLNEFVALRGLKVPGIAACHSPDNKNNL